MSEEQGFFRRLIGPNREEVWRKLAAEIGGEYVDGGFWRGDKVEVRHHSWTLTLDTYTVSTGKVTVTYTRMRAPFVNTRGFRFRIYRKSVFTGIATWLGMQDITIGDAAFDEAFVIQGNDEAKVRSLFFDPRLRELVTQQPSLSLEVRDDEGWFGPDFPEGVDELRFTVTGVITDLARLRGIFELFAETLDRLCEIGAATDRPTGMAPLR